MRSRVVHRSLISTLQLGKTPTRRLKACATYSLPQMLFLFTSEVSRIAQLVQGREVTKEGRFSLIDSHLKYKTVHDRLVMM